MKFFIQLLCVVYCCAPATLAAAVKYVGIDLYTLQTATLSSVFPRSAANGMVVGHGVPSGDFNGHAIVWSSPHGEAVDLLPSGASDAWAADGVRQAGSSDIGHALLWEGTAASVIDLHPTSLAGIQGSRLFGMSITQQVGSVDGPGTGDKFHAALWNGSADSAIDLHPVNLNYIVESAALATDGVQQAGYGLKADGYRRALLWAGTAESAVDLHPLHFNGASDESEALGVGGSQQVGRAGGASTGGRNHAFLWTGAASSAVDLHPTHLNGFFDTFAVTTNGQIQAGYGGIVPNTSDHSHALAWSGTAGSAVDLHTFLPAIFEVGASRALSIDAQGNIFGIATDSLARYHAVMWAPIPEPTALWLVLCAGFCTHATYASRSFAK